MTDELSERFQTLQHPGAPAWHDVVERAGSRGGRRKMLLAAAAAVVLAIAAPTALALRGAIVDFFESERAPRGVVLDFQRMDTGAPPGLNNEVVYGQTRKIFERRIGDGRVLTLWVAPNRREGFCMALSGPKHPGGFSCLWDHRPPISTTQELGASSPDGVILRGPFLVWGTLELEDAQTIEMRYEDGTRERQAVTWVSEPIGAGFFLFDIGEAHWAAGHRIHDLVVRDGNGSELWRNALPYRLPLSGPQASTRD
jgi:hypothetical protein